MFLIGDVNNLSSCNIWSGIIHYQSRPVHSQYHSFHPKMSWPLYLESIPQRSAGDTITDKPQTTNTYDICQNDSSNIIYKEETFLRNHSCCRQLDKWGVCHRWYVSTFRLSKLSGHTQLHDWFQKNCWFSEDLSGLPELVEVVKLQSTGPGEASRAIRKKLKYGNVSDESRDASSPVILTLFLTTGSSPVTSTHSFGWHDSKCWWSLSARFCRWNATRTSSCLWHFRVVGMYILCDFIQLLCIVASRAL